MKGGDLSYEKDELEVYCPQMLRWHRLESQWHITTPFHLSEMKKDNGFMHHLQIMGTFITCTNITVSKKEAYSWVLFSHAMLTSRTDTVAEMQK
eukprot:12013381-Ditylum_brightwellii.AAC.1